jgi:hypothetical protein
MEDFVAAVLAYREAIQAHEAARAVYRAKRDECEALDKARDEAYQAMDAAERRVIEICRTRTMVVAAV